MKCWMETGVGWYVEYFSSEARKRACSSPLLPAAWAAPIQGAEEVDTCFNDKIVRDEADADKRIMLGFKMKPLILKLKKDII